MIANNSVRSSVMSAANRRHLHQIVSPCLDECAAASALPGKHTVRAHVNAWSWTAWRTRYCRLFIRGRRHNFRGLRRCTEIHRFRRRCRCVFSNVRFLTGSIGREAKCSQHSSYGLSSPLKWCRRVPYECLSFVGGLPHRGGARANPRTRCSWLASACFLAHVSANSTSPTTRASMLIDYCDYRQRRNCSAPVAARSARVGAVRDLMAG